MITTIVPADDAAFAAICGGGPEGSFPVIEGGIEAPETLAMLRQLANNIRTVFVPAAWMIIDRDMVVGLCSLVKPPTGDGAVEIGYGIAASLRCRGIATRAIRALVEWAHYDPRVTAVRAETSVDNVASQIVLERSAFVRVGLRTDVDDGLLIQWAAQTPS